MMILDIACPHCAGPLPVGWTTESAGRCPLCNASIEGGTVRPLDDPPTTGQSGQANSTASLRPTSQSEVLLLILEHVAHESDCEIRELTMLQYQAAAAGRSLPPLAHVLETFGSWQEAIRCASALPRAPTPGGGPG